MEGDQDIHIIHINQRNDAGYVLASEISFCLNMTLIVIANSMGFCCLIPNGERCVITQPANLLHRTMDTVYMANCLCAKVLVSGAFRGAAGGKGRAKVTATRSAVKVE